MSFSEYDVFCNGSSWDDFELFESESFGGGSDVAVSEENSDALCLDDGSQAWDADNCDDDLWSSNGNKRRNNIKKRRRNLPLPRIIRNDIRRHYAQMFINIINSDNPNMLKSFLNTFSVENVKITKVFQSLSALNIGEFDEPLPNALGVFIRGRDNIVQDMRNKQNLMPDMVARLSDCKIIRKPYETACRIACNVELSVTILYDLSAACSSVELKNYEEDGVIIRANDNSGCGLEGDMRLAGSNEMKFAHWMQTQLILTTGMEKLKSKLVLLKNPIRKSWSGCFSINVNERKQIEGITFYRSKSALFSE